MSKLKKGMSLVSIIGLGALLMTGCTQTDEITLDGTYSFSGVISVEIDFSEDGKADYGYPGVYSRTNGEDGTMYIHMGYGYPSDFTKANISTYEVTDLGDGSVSIQSVNADGDAKPRTLKFEEGSEGILGTENFEGECTTDDGMTIQFEEDGTYVQFRELDYSMDKEQLTLGSGDNKTVYNYTLSDDKSELVLSNESGSKQWDFKLLEE